MWGKVFGLCVLSWAVGAASAWAGDSAYTSLKPEDCRTIEESTEGAGSIQECQGRDGYRVMVVDDDSRSWLRVRPPRGNTVDLGPETAETVRGQFPNIAGTPLEWRYGSRGNRPIALIYRINSMDDETGQKLTTLLVVRVADDRLCVIGAAAGNAEARALADSRRGCP